MQGRRQAPQQEFRSVFSPPSPSLGKGLGDGEISAGHPRDKLVPIHQDQHAINQHFNIDRSTIPKDNQFLFSLMQLQLGICHFMFTYANKHRFNDTKRVKKIS